MAYDCGDGYNRAVQEAAMKALEISGTGIIIFVLATIGFFILCFVIAANNDGVLVKHTSSGQNQPAVIQPNAKCDSSEHTGTDQYGNVIIYHIQCK